MSEPSNTPTTLAEMWLDAAADLLDEAKLLREQAVRKERDAKKCVLLAEQWEREQKEKSGV